MRKLPFDEDDLTAGQYRKLNGLRKSLGNSIANRYFCEWLEESGQIAGKNDQGAAAIRQLIEPAILQGKIRIPQGGYVLRRGKGRVIVQRKD